MPLKWKRGRNPYVWNAFGVLGAGPNTPDLQVAALAGKQTKRLKADKIELGGQAIDLFEIGEARKTLLDKRLRAGELPLVHPQARIDRSQLEALRTKLREVAVLPESFEPPPLLHPTAVLWFIPAPSPDAIRRPNLEELDFVASGDERDRALDIVFDT